MENKVLYDQIGIGYNLTRQADPYITERLYQLLAPDTSGTYLDIGCGTGNYTIALANKGLSFTGVEPSVEMLATARLKDKTINWLQGTAEQIPAGDEQFDSIIATLTIHHWVDLDKAFAEISRVLKEAGRLVIFTATPQQMQGYWLNHYFPKMVADSILQMPTYETIIAAANKAGLHIINTEKYFIQDDLKDNFLYAGKNKPQIYLNAEVRKGISSFAALADEEEVEQGLKTLETDLQSGSFGTVKAGYDDNGDYIFIVMEKIKSSS